MHRPLAAVACLLITAIPHSADAETFKLLRVSTEERAAVFLLPDDAYPVGFKNGATTLMVYSSPRDLQLKSKVDWIVASYEFNCSDHKSRIYASAAFKLDGTKLFISATPDKWSAVGEAGSITWLVERHVCDKNDDGLNEHKAASAGALVGEVRNTLINIFPAEPAPADGAR